ncbi:MAG: DNA glycosylase [Clostridia bacterium]|jgi:N-glycosylase/DNA lyase|nr:hypothetical protein [Clostridia bacterium]
MLNYEIKNNKIIIEPSDEFNITHILECGQVFRFKKFENFYRVFVLDKFADIYNNEKNQNIIETSDTHFFVNYFDLKTNYAIIKQKLERNNILHQAIKCAYGIRILKQDNIEATFDFIISANNNIKRIQQIIEALCQNLGKKCSGYYAFPNVESLANASVDFYKKIGAGYRADYLHKTANLLKNGFDMEVVHTMSAEQATKYLQILNGIGPKVADCILLYGYHKMNVFPVDTWIKKVYSCYYNNKIKSPALIRKNLINNFGEISGYAQQYLFYFKRELDKKGD